MKKFSKLLVMALVLTTAIGATLGLTACNDSNNQIVVFTNAFFAPFEYYDGNEIVGVDVDIMKKVGEKMGKSVKFENKDFNQLIDYISDGSLCDCGAAGFTITESRKEKVNFSIPYYTSTQYAIFAKDALATNTSNDAAAVKCVYWDELAGKKIGVQMDTTGDIYVGIEIDGDDGYDGVLEGKNASKVQYDDAQLAYQNLKSGQIDVVVVDELPAQYLIKNDGTSYVALPLYYKGYTDSETGEEIKDSATQEEYGIAVNKNQPELLKSINEVLSELLAKKNDAGQNGVEQLVMQHFSLN